ncbi:MAG: DUF6084 family protein [Candidatus Binatia bacterium]
MSEIAFAVTGAAPERFAAVPTIAFDLQLESMGQVVHSIALHCQIRFEPQRRRYSDAEQARLRDLFGETPRWGDTLKPFLWTHVSATLAGFTECTPAVLSVPCTYDLEVAGAKYLHSLDDGEIPLLFLFSGTVFSKGAAGLQLTQLSWHRDARYRLPVAVWRQLMDLYFPNSGWLRLRRDTLDALLRFKARRVLTTWDETVGALLEQAGEAR